MKPITAIAPAWPLQHLVATNPMAGFESMPFDEALRHAKAYFQQQELPEGMQRVNRISIKWLQIFFDQGQATIAMPNRDQGFLQTMRQLLVWDKQVHQGRRERQQWIRQLPATAEGVVQQCLGYFQYSPEQTNQYLTLLLTTLPGWSAYIQYRINTDASITQAEYLAFRLILTHVLWPESASLLAWHEQAMNTADVDDLYEQLCVRESAYKAKLGIQLQSAHMRGNQAKTLAPAQWVCCIDVRSEPLRRALEMKGQYETFGYAGFFGVPVSIEDAITGSRHASCPVLLTPAHNIVERPIYAEHNCRKRYRAIQAVKQLYQSLKYTFTTPFSLVETLGLSAGIWMGIRTLSPRLSRWITRYLKKIAHQDIQRVPILSSIPVQEQLRYAANMLTSIGLTQHFSPLVILCGHGSTTQNNAHATALDCGACGGNKGGANARILAAILNHPIIRSKLAEEYGIVVPDQTWFVAAQHNTTTSDIDIADQVVPTAHRAALDAVKEKIQSITAILGGKNRQQRAYDWAQVRPEWGLAKNASFIIAPRWLTQGIDLEGRAFLHSYEWEQDKDGAILAGILTAPMIVAQWINAQYFFSTLDPVAFGSGSKITANVCGKIGLMQGNASDLMHGLSVQSLFVSDTQSYHPLQRLLIVIYAPNSHVDAVIGRCPGVKNLIEQGWVSSLIISLD